MKKLKVGDLKKIRDKVQKTTNLRKSQSRAVITVHMGTCGIAAGSRQILTRIMAILEKKKIDDVLVTTSGCAGFCSREPMITVEVKGEPPVKYGDLTEQRIDKIISQHIIQGNLVKEFVLALGSERTY
ncbi:MAG: hypothetical protein APR63_07110 [Desulfuromonas sp. SDB]|nr:MAG: hypothetical protein APR63_07110 [Desulfuromonas sp. SDB]